MSVEKRNPSFLDRVHDELVDSVDEELELEIDDDRLASLLDHVTDSPEHDPQALSPFCHISTKSVDVICLSQKALGLCTRYLRESRCDAPIRVGGDNAEQVISVG